MKKQDFLPSIIISYRKKKKISSGKNLLNAKKSFVRDMVWEGDLTVAKVKEKLAFRYTLDCEYFQTVYEFSNSTLKKYQVKENENPADINWYALKEVDILNF